MLSPHQIQQFQTQGYCTAPQFLDPAELAALRSELHRLQQDGLLGNVATGDAGGRLNLQICPLWPHSKLFAALPYRHGLAEALAQLIGDPVVFRLDQIFLKPANHGMGTSWHQDNFYFKIPNPRHGVGLWIALHDAHAANGTMRIVPGAEQPDLPHERDPNSNHHSRCHPDESRAITVELPAGGALFFHYNIPHCTGSNTTDKDRAGLALHFYNGAMGAGDLHFTPESHAVLTGPDATHGVKEREEDMRGVWEELVARA